MRLSLLAWGAVACATLPGGASEAQAPPGTDVYLLALRRAGDSFDVGPPENLTARAGYDNQPAFSPDGRQLYFTSIRDGQADIYAIALDTRLVTRFTETPESEYSATPIPGGRDVAVVRVERDSTQRLWAFPAAGGPPRLLLERVAPVGYQAWLDADRVALFVLGSPPTLRVASLATGRAATLLSAIGRSLQPLPAREAVLVTRMVAEGVWWLTEVDGATGGARPLIRMPAGADYAVPLPDGSLLTAAGTNLLRWRPDADATWRSLATLQAAGLGPVSRLAVSPRGDWLAVVAEER